MSQPHPGDPDKLAEESNRSIGKVRELVDELKTVEEHERIIIGGDPPEKSS
jgi:hypothetical protein